MSPRPDTPPASTRLSEAPVPELIGALQERYANCDLCAHECGVDRTAGETGVCGAGPTPIVASACPHHGEEAVLSGQRGSGTIFLGHCNLGCVFCQNADISQDGRGNPASPEDIGETALDLQRRGCHNVNFVTPTHFTPSLVEGIRIARENGLDIPVVWNCGGYERPAIVSLLDGIVDIYMPDVKWSIEEAAVRYSGAPGYWESVKGSLETMHRQVGDLSVDDDGLATDGLLVRHLLMPDHVENAKRVLTFLAEEISTDTYVNLLSQYRPQYKVRTEDQYEAIDRRVTSEEYGAVVEHGRDLGLERLHFDRTLA